MTLEQPIDDIRVGIKAGDYKSEADVSRGIVLRIFTALGWDAFNPAVVSSEYGVENRRVDYALCYPPRKPFAFVEVKNLGKSVGAEKQLFEYAYHEGVPLAILTDGRDWSFFLPLQRGNYQDRVLCKFDLVDTDTAECAGWFMRYLHYGAVVAGDAQKAADDDYGRVLIDRAIADALPKAWHDLVSGADARLLEILANRVKDLCGSKPSPEIVANFLKAARSEPRPVVLSQKVAVIKPLPMTPAAVVMPLPAPMGVGFSYGGQFYPAKSAISVLIAVVELFIALDPSFPEKFSTLNVKPRSILFKDPTEYDQTRIRRLSCGWWLYVNLSRANIEINIQKICEVAGVTYGKDLIINLGG